RAAPHSDRYSSIASVAYWRNRGDARVSVAESAKNRSLRVTPMGRQAQLGDKMVSAEEAVAHIRSGQSVGIAMGAEPIALALALGKRARELSEIRIMDNWAKHPHVWYQDPPDPAFHVESSFLTEYSRPLAARGLID